MSTAPGITVTARPGVGFEEHHVDVDGFRVRYLTAGTGEALVMLHGGGGIEFNPGHDLLAETFAVTAIEMPGFGAQDNDRTNTMAELADLIAKITSAIGLDTFRLLGTSFGGSTALWFAIRHPDRLTHLVLEVPASFRTGSPRPDTLTPQQFTAAFHAHPQRKPWLTPPDPTRLAKNMAFIGRVFGPEHDPELETLLPAVFTPTLVLLGTRDGLFGTRPGKHYARLLPQVSVQHVYDAAHDLSGDRPEAFADIVTDFLNRGMAFRITHRPTVLNP